VNRGGEPKDRACFSARDVPRLPQTRLNSPTLTRPYRSPGKLYSTELFAEFIYSLVTPRKLAEKAPANPLDKEGEREREEGPVRYIERIRN